MIGGVEYDQILGNLRTAYDAMAHQRDESRIQEWKAAERQRFLNQLRVASARRLLEIGAGTGVHGKFFQDQGFQVIATDLSPELVELCRAKGLEAYVRDFLNLDFPAASFDAVFGMNCLLHVPRVNLVPVLRAVEEVLKPGGLFYWGQYGGFEFEGIWEDDSDYEPKRFFSYLRDADIQRTAGEVFEIIDFRTIDVGSGRGDHHYQSLTLRRR
jgi:SAM-dependent methyltransferase